MSSFVHTVLGPVPAADLGPVAVHESLLCVVPGAQYAYDIEIDRAEIFDTLAALLRELHAAGGRTIVDTTGMFHGRDLRLLETLSRSTGIHIVASTGMGPEENLGGYFLTPQTNPPTPWAAERFAGLFSAEVTEGMVVPRVERRGLAGLIVTATSTGGRTPTDESLVRGAAISGTTTGAPVSIRFGVDPLDDLDLALATGIDPARVVIAGLDRRDAAHVALQVAERGARVGIDHVGIDDPAHLTDAERVDLIIDLLAAGHATRILLSAGAVGVGKGLPATATTFATVLTDFVPKLKAAGVGDADIHTILVDGPRDLLTVKGN